MSFDTDEARAQRDALLICAEDSPVRQLRYHLRRRALEWTKAIDAVDDLDDDGVIELAGSLTIGMQVVYPNAAGNYAWLLRFLRTGGQLSLHVEDDDGRPNYINLLDSDSPVAVRS